MKIKNYSFETDKLRRNLRIALVSDLHSREPLAVIEAKRYLADLEGTEVTFSYPA